MLTAGALSAAAAVAQARVGEATSQRAPEAEARLEPAILVAPVFMSGLRQARTDSITAIADSGPEAQPMSGFDPVAQSPTAAAAKRALTGHRPHRRAVAHDLPRAGSRTAERD